MDVSGGGELEEVVGRMGGLGLGGGDVGAG